MMSNQIALIRREMWEHRGIFVTPLVIGLIVTLLSVTGQISISTFDEAVDIAIIGASNLNEHQRAAAINALMTSVSIMFVFAMCILTIFYSLDALYAERKDKSILFWRSMPTTDAETVISKLLTASLVIPVVTFLVIITTHLLVLAVTSVWVGLQGANAWHLLWNAAPIVDNWLATLVFLLAIPLWLSPYIGWFLLVSAYTKRSPLLAAFLPIIIVPMLERSLVGTTIFADAFFVRSVKMPLFSGMESAEVFFENAEGMHRMAESGISLWSLLDLSGFLMHPGLWLGLLVCATFTTAAIYVRRYRDDS
jgi:ABC-2 type transport system permease protein